jgi:hypothetical protein
MAPSETLGAFSCARTAFAQVIAHTVEPVPMPPAAYRLSVSHLAGIPAI